jgi:hypothetical protein
MAGVAQLVRALGCGSGGRRFETGHSPHFFFSISIALLVYFFICPIIAGDVNQKQTRVAPNSLIDSLTVFEKKHGEHNSLNVVIKDFGMFLDLSKTAISKLSNNVLLAVPWYAPNNNSLMDQAHKNGFSFLLGFDDTLPEAENIIKFLRKDKRFVGIFLNTSSDDQEKYKEIIDFAQKNSLLVVFAYSPIFANKDNYYISCEENIDHKIDSIEKLNEKLSKIYARIVSEKKITACFCLNDLTANPLFEWLQNMVNKGIKLESLLKSTSNNKSLNQEVSLL